MEAAFLYANETKGFCQMEIRLKGIKAWMFIVILVLGVINLVVQLVRLFRG